MSMPTQNPLLRPLKVEPDDSLRYEIANLIWGPDQDKIQRKDILQYYFRYYSDQITAPTASARPTKQSRCILRPIETHMELSLVILLLRSNPDKTRKTIKHLLAQDNDSLGLGPSVDIDAAIDLTVRIMFMVSCRTSRNEFTTGHIFTPVWKQTESLHEFMDRVITQSDIDSSEKAELINVQKLRGRYLRQYANIKIIWTSNLLDHLLLGVNDSYKTLRVFKHMGFLEVNSRALASQDTNLSTAKSLSLGCLPPSLISETIHSIQLLFPENDYKSRKFLTNAINRDGLDYRLVGPYQISHHYEEYAIDAPLPSYVQELFEEFPYWGDRLYKILKEVEDPTPMMWYERWSDRKKNPRYTYWAGVVTLGLALLFGILATILGALQVWISYCSWQGRSAGHVCKAPVDSAASATSL